MKKKSKKWLIFVGLSILLLWVAHAKWLPSVGAALILYPPRKLVISALPADCENISFQGNSVTIQGWRSKGSDQGRGTLVYLHGVADNRSSASGIIKRFHKLGFRVVAYDSRAHGESEGECCTYGFFEKEDLRRIVDSFDSGPIILFGSSLGAAVALQAAAVDERVTAVIAAEVFSDFRTVAIERAPVFFSSGTIERAFRIAEQKGRFKLSEVSPVNAGRKIRVPVLLIHGESDIDTTPDHAQRVYDALGGPKRLILVPGAGHNESLNGDVWQDIERWVDVIAPQP